MLATEETEAEGWKISGLPGLQSKFITNLKNLVRSCLKIKSEKGVVLECYLAHMRPQVPSRDCGK